MTPGPVDPSHLDGGGLRRPLIVAAALALAAGYVDAVVFLRIFEVFPANQSGNLVLLGVAIGGGNASAAIAHSTALVAYVVGAAFGVRAFDLTVRPPDESVLDSSPDRTGRAPRERFLGAVGLEAAILALLAGGLWVTGRARTGPADFDGLAAAAIAAAAFAMGLQSIAVRSVHKVSTLTTGATGDVTSLGVVIARLGERGERRRALDGLSVLTGIIVPYLGGAIVGAALVELTDLGGVLVAVPAVGLAALLWVESRSKPPA